MVPQPGLSTGRVVDAATAVADCGGLTAVSMRSVGKELGVEAMSLYHHVAGKDALLDALAESVFAQVELPGAGEPWRTAMTRRARSARSVLGAHPWAVGLIESRPVPGPSLLRHHDAVVACLVGNGFPMRLAAHAFSVLDAYVYGFVVTEQNLPFEEVGGEAEYAAGLSVEVAEYPHLVGMLGHLLGEPGYRFGDEFEYGLEIVLDGLQARLAAEVGR
ncbi:TetR/AcrR family transcriptional regulator [Phycicoccus avicenniae]|uniref:TetR/AcrR family transcriptional regulator n=1 Tax=Phycicoccus avicenniae TaxID=2828860 RepID=UPI002011D043|nr:TetR/AcrR family transcriptional regulator [Phycicoccus avicenniae]